MRHLLMDPNYPDLVAQWATEELEGETRARANDNHEDIDGLGDPLLTEFARLEVAATRLW